MPAFDLQTTVYSVAQWIPVKWALSSQQLQNINSISCQSEENCLKKLRNSLERNLKLSLTLTQTVDKEANAAHKRRVKVRKSQI